MPKSKGHPTYKVTKKLRRWAIIGIATSIASIALLLVIERRGSTTQNGGSLEGVSLDINPARRKNEEPLVASPQLKLLGPAVFRNPTADEDKMAKNLIGGLNQPKPSEVPGNAPRAKSPKTTVPKQARLSESQRKNLQRLQWGLVKEVNFQSDGEDSTVRALYSTALTGPKDSIGETPEKPDEKMLRFISENRDLFLIKNPVDELSVVSVEADSLGIRTVRLSQKYLGLEVWPSQLTGRVTAAGYLTIVTGAYVPTPELTDLIPRIQPDEALALASRLVSPNGALELNAVHKPALKIFTEKGSAPELAYDVLLRTRGSLRRVFVGAVTGGILASFSELCEAGSDTTATDLIGQTRSINVLPYGNPLRYYLYDTSKPMYSASSNTGVIRIYEAGSYPPILSVSSSLTSGFDPAAVSASFNLSRTYDFYSQVLGRNSYDGKGGSITAWVRMYENGLPMANAFWDPTLRIIGFGAADKYPAAPDVVAHEFTHAVVSETSKLVYRYESGALSESISDIIGEAFERFLYGSNDWLSGTILKAPLRSLKDPEIKNQPRSMSRYVRTTEDNGGVHINSGIPNHAFYLLAEGLQGGGVGFDAALKIFFSAFTTKLNQNSNFIDLRTACVLSAKEIYGAGSAQTVKTGQAFDAVEIYDSSAFLEPDNLTPPTGADSYLITYMAVDGNKYLGRREAGLGDGNSLTAISAIPLDLNSRVSVSGNGALAAFISASYDAVFVQTNGSSGGAAGAPGNFNSVAVSADGAWLAAIARNPVTGIPMSKIIYLNVASGGSTVIDLYQPFMDGPSSTSILSVDEVDLSPDGQIAIFDAYAMATLADGTVLKGWSVFGLDIRSKSVISLYGPVSGVDIGNPSFSRTSDRRLIFEAFSTTASGVFAVDLGKGTASQVRAFSPANIFLAYPRFSSADDFVVFTEDFYSPVSFGYRPQVSRISLAPDRITASGAPSVLQTYAYGGVSYRRGVFAGAPRLAASAAVSTIKGGQSGSFRVSRVSGDSTIRVPFSFKMVGTARANSDYVPLEQTGVIPAGAAYVDIIVRAVDSVFVSGRVITLSLDPLSHYTIDKSEASITIVPSVAPVINSQPVSQVAAVGANVIYEVSASDSGASFQWYRNGVAIVGATGSKFTITSAQVKDVGNYTVTITNAAGSVTSGIATLEFTQAGYGATHIVLGGGYIGGQTVTIVNTLSFLGAPNSVSYSVLLPSGWSYASSAGSVGVGLPKAGDSGVLNWSWSTVPPSPLTFVYTLNVPLATSGSQELVGLAGIGSPISLQFLARPDPLVVELVTTHSADTDKNGKINLQELTRLIELYNTRNVTTRTGCYAPAQVVTEDGFAADGGRSGSAAVAIGRYHSSDINRDGKISLTELTRVIELYNYRSGTTRTGQYKPASGTEDGFAPGP